MFLQERDRLISENTELSDQCEQLQADIVRLNGLLDKLGEDKALLADQVASLQAKGEVKTVMVFN